MASHLIGQNQITTFASPVNATSPIDANTVRGNDNTIKTSYNLHDNNETMHVQDSLVASRPAASVAGRKWLATDAAAFYLYYDDGAAWNEISYIRSASPTFTGALISTTAFATPAALAATQFTAFASTVSGATLMGYGTTGDVTLKNQAGTDVLVVTQNSLNITLAGQALFTTKLISTTALATPAALVATTGELFASTVSGATLMGFGTTGDVTLKNRAGTDVIVVTSNTLNVTMAGALAITGALSGVTTLGGTGAVSGFTTAAFSGDLQIGTGSGTVATSADIRLRNSGPIRWRNNANSANIGIYLSNIDKITLEGALDLNTNALSGVTTLAGTGAVSGFTTIACSSTITTGAPTGGAGAWLLGVANSVSPTAPNRTITVNIGGTLYYLAAKTTND